MKPEGLSMRGRRQVTYVGMEGRVRYPCARVRPVRRTLGFICIRSRLREQRGTARRYRHGHARPGPTCRFHSACSRGL